MKLDEIQISVSTVRFIVIHPHSFIHILSLDTLLPQWQSWVVVIEMVWPMKPKVYTIWFFTEKIC